MQPVKGAVISSAYRDLAMGFIATVFFVTIVRSLLKDAVGNNYIRFLIPLFAPMIIVIFGLSFRVIAKLQVSKSAIHVMIGLLVAAIVTRLISLAVDELPLEQALSLLSSLLIVIVWGAIIYRMIINLFGQGSHIIEKL